MDSSLIQTLFTAIANNIFLIIYLFVAVETVLAVTIFTLLKKHELVLLDVSDNLLKGFRDAPDKDSTANVHDNFQRAIDFMKYKISNDPSMKKTFSENAKGLSQRSVFGRYYNIEVFASLLSTIVQIFPLLGILGTILAIAQTAFQNQGQVDVSSLSNAFVLAMDTTILGIFFSILFMVVESWLAPKIERIINESLEFRKIIANIQLSNHQES
ncbi:MAG: MotA/TolQ/ExbB proton channel family protein [Bdellovibrionota bacterium]|nr:MotA/TolQ/ExbB proton channel family protein [Bdellovibrionota bacterium]